MSGISVREFARRDGCDEALVRRAIKQKKLATLEDGSIDPALVRSGWRKSNRRVADKSADKTSAVRTVKTEGRQRVEREAPPPKQEPDLKSLEDFIDRILRGEFSTLADAEMVKENALALKHLLEGRKKAGELVDARAAQTVLFEEFRSARDAWLNFPARVGSLIAAELGIDAERVVETLTAHVHRQLSDLGEPDLEFGEPARPAAPGGEARVDAAAPDQHPGVG